MFLKASLLLCVNLALSAAMYSSRDAVVELTPTNFKHEVLNNDKLVAVEFYAPWCGHCQRLAPEWKKAANNLKELVTVAAINCDEDDNKPLCGQYEIKGFPTIKLFRSSVNKKGVRTKYPTDYQGPREAKPIVDHLLSLQPSNVRLIKGDPSKVKSKASISLDDFLAADNATLPKVILFTDKPTTTPLYKALSVDFGNGRLMMGEVKKTEKEVLDQFGITKFPTLMVLKPGENAESSVYGGKLKYQPLYDHLSTFALEGTNRNSNSKNNSNNKNKNNDKKKEKKSSSNDENENPIPEPAVKPNVEELSTNDILEQHCLKAGNIICTIAIVSPEEKDEGVNVLNQVNDENTNSLFRFAWMTNEKAKDIIQQLDLADDYPGLFILHPSKHLYRPYIGPWDTKSISRWLNQIASGRVQAWSYDGELKLSEVESHQQQEQVEEEKEDEQQNEGTAEEEQSDVNEEQEQPQEERVRDEL